MPNMDYVTDTYSLIWYFTEDSRLGKNDLKAFESTVIEGIMIVPITKDKFIKKVRIMPTIWKHRNFVLCVMLNVKC